MLALPRQSSTGPSTGFEVIVPGREWIRFELPQFELVRLEGIAVQSPKCSCCAGCSMKINRRAFLTAAGATALSLQMDALDFASSLFAAETRPADKPLVHVVFVRPTKTPIVSWPGGQTDVNAQQALFTKTLADSAKKLGIQLDLRSEPLENREAVNGYLEQLKKTQSDGLIIGAMEQTHLEDVHHLTQNRGDIPTIVYSNMIAFTGQLRASRKLPKTYVAATQDVEYLAFCLRMLNAVWRVKNTRIALLVGNESKDETVQGLGTTLHRLPAARFDEELKKVELSEEVRAMADQYAKNAQEIVEPSKTDILEAAKNYIVCRRIMAAENCQGLSFACLGRPNPVCMAFSRLLDEGVVAGCEADVNAALSMLLTQLLFERSGFIQDPSPNTVNNTLIGAHCTSPTRLEGFDKPYRAPYKLRSYHTATGAAMQVLWPIGRDVTVMQFQGPDTMILGSGRVVSNIAQPPSGCCRTAVEITVDGVADTDDCKGFHQLFILGKLEHDFAAYCQLAGIKTVHI